MRFLIISFFAGIVAAITWLFGVTLFLPSIFSVLIFPVKILEWVDSHGWLKLDEVSMNQLALVSQFAFYFVVSYLFLFLKNRVNEENS